MNGFKLTFALWNLILGAIPFLLAGFICRFKRKNGLVLLRQKAAAVAAGAVWLLFLPNTAYVITDLRHISGYCGDALFRVCVENGWMPVVFFVFAAIGWIAFVFAVRQMREIIASVFGFMKARIAAYVLVFLTAWGLLMGLLQRFNSWEIFTDPARILKGSLVYYYDPLYFRNLIAYAVSLSLLYFIGEKIFSGKAYGKFIKLFNGK